MDSVQMGDLSSPEKFVVWSLRIALLPAIDSGTARRTLERAFSTVKLPEALPPLLEVATTVNAVWHELQRVPDIHCACSIDISHDEWLLLQTLAALQIDRAELALHLAGRILPLGGARLILGPAKQVAAVLSRAGWTLRCVRRDAANVSLLPHGVMTQRALH